MYLVMIQMSLFSLFFACLVIVVVSIFHMTKFDCPIPNFNKYHLIKLNLYPYINFCFIIVNL
eukprot:UN03675